MQDLWERERQRFEIALASQNDADGIRAIDVASFAQPTTDPIAELDRPWARLWIARPEGGGAPAAFLLVWFAADEMHVLSVATHPAHRRSGLARSLLGRALETARSQRARLVLLEVRRSNVGAITLYRQLGFETMGVRARYYADGEDALEMALVLDPGTGEREPGRAEPRG